MQKALIIVDVQNDFCPNGSLAVADGDKVVEPLNNLSNHARQHGWVVVASRDWHPLVTKHFKEYGGIWPVHCVAESKGAAFHKDLDITNAIIISKGVSDRDDYSAFDGRTDSGVPLGMYLDGKAVKEIYVGGLATDYCVKETVLASCRWGFRTYFLKDASRAVNINPNDEAKAIEEMVRLGTIITTTDEVIHDTAKV
jgi:nicotinamidase/pyrazinamidase